MKTSHSLILLLALCSVIGCNAQQAEDGMAAARDASPPQAESMDESMGADMAVDEATAMEEAMPMGESFAAEESFDADMGESLSDAAEPEMAMAMPPGAERSAPAVASGKAPMLAREKMVVQPMMLDPPMVSRVPSMEVARSQAAPKAFSNTPLQNTGAKKLQSAPAEEMAARATPMANAPPETRSESPVPSGPFQSLPAGAEHHPELGFATVQVYYATDRKVSDVPLSQHHLGGNRDAVILLGALGLIFSLLGLKNFVQRRGQHGLIWGMMSGAAIAGVAYVMLAGDAGIEKRGVTYTADRGELARGICQVTVPDVHERGQVERPSLLRFEVHEDQKKHIVLTSATELGSADFYQRLSQTVTESTNNDLLVFIHGYNVDFQSAVARTAQIAIDLPFEGVPVCYSWPSQASLFGYTIDETNAEWTQSDLKQFLTELVQQSGAKAINVIAHSMGNRPTTGAIVEMQREGIGPSGRDGPFLDRIVLAAPDVDADRFRRDLAPQLTSAAQQVTLYASSDDQALIASKKVHGYPRAGESGEHVVVVPGVDTIDVSGIDLSLLGHSYYGNHDSMLRDLYDVVKKRLPAIERTRLNPRRLGELTYWQLSDAVIRAASKQKPLADR